MKVAGDSLITNPLRPLGVATDRAEEEEVVEGVEVNNRMITVHDF